MQFATGEKNVNVNENENDRKPPSRDFDYRLIINFFLNTSFVKLVFSQM